MSSWCFHRLLGSLLLVGAGEAAAQAPFLAAGEDAVLFGGVVSHSMNARGPDALGAGVGFTVASWTQIDASVSRVGDRSTGYGTGIEIYPLRLLGGGVLEPFCAFGWAHTVVFTEDRSLRLTTAGESIELDVFPVSAGVSARADIAPRFRGVLQLSAVHATGDLGPGNRDRTGWHASLGLWFDLTPRYGLVVVPSIANSLDQEIGSLLVGLQFDRP